MAKSPFASLQVLVVDDDAHMRGILDTLLRDLGVKQVVHASDGEEALAIMRGRPIDIVICELVMGKSDGLEFIRLVRTAADSANPYVPIIVVTSHTEKRRVIEARDAGATEFVAKPVSARQLYERIVAIVVEPRQFVRAASYFGPDRRRRIDDFYHGPERRERGEGDDPE